MPNRESVARLKFCLRTIGTRIVDPRYAQQRWFWELRENVALFALRSLVHHPDDLNVADLSPAEQQATLATHPLLTPYLPLAISPPNHARRELQAAIRLKLAESYLSRSHHAAAPDNGV